MNHKFLATTSKISEKIVFRCAQTLFSSLVGALHSLVTHENEIRAVIYCNLSAFFSCRSHHQQIIFFRLPVVLLSYSHPAAGFAKCLPPRLLLPPLPQTQWKSLPSPPPLPPRTSPPPFPPP